MWDSNLTPLDIGSQSSIELHKKSCIHLKLKDLIAIVHHKQMNEQLKQYNEALVISLPDYIVAHTMDPDEYANHFNYVFNTQLNRPIKSTLFSFVLS